MKAKTASEANKLTDIPNIGPAMVRDFAKIGITSPKHLATADGYDLYVKVCDSYGVRMDPCVLDTYLAAVDFMNGAPAKPWWNYTAMRKRQYPDI